MNQIEADKNIIIQNLTNGTYTWRWNWWIETKIDLRERMWATIRGACRLRRRDRSRTWTRALPRRCGLASASWSSAGHGGPASFLRRSFELSPAAFRSEKLRRTEKCQCKRERGVSKPFSEVVNLKVRARGTEVWDLGVFFPRFC